MPVFDVFRNLRQLPAWSRPVLFITCYFVLNRLYFEIPNDVLKDLVYFQGVTLVCANIIKFVAPQEAVSAIHNHLVSPSADLEIIRGCDGAGALFLVLSAILASPSSFLRKLWGMALGIGLLYVFNLIRVSGLYFLIVYHADWFELIHTYIAPSFIIVIGCLYFAWWAFSSTQKSYEPS